MRRPAVYLAFATDRLPPDLRGQASRRLPPEQAQARLDLAHDMLTNRTIRVARDHLTRDSPCSSG